jgi:Ras-related protein Rab-8A
MKDQKVVDTARGEDLARHYGIKFFETSAKSNENVKEAFYAISKDIKKRLMDSNQQKDTGGVVNLHEGKGGGGGGCCSK